MGKSESAPRCATSCTVASRILALVVSLAILLGVFLWFYRSIVQTGLATFTINCTLAVFISAAARCKNTSTTNFGHIATDLDKAFVENTASSESNAATIYCHVMKELDVNVIKYRLALHEDPSPVLLCCIPQCGGRDETEIKEKGAGEEEAE